MKKFILSLLLFILSNPLLFSFSHTHVMTNYTEKDYNAKFQNWDITQDEKGRIFVANGDGMLIFDGTTWTLVENPNATIIRSIHSNDGKIYAGSFEEFGYFSETPDGNFSYNSISAGINDRNFLKNEEIWKILPWRDKILFQSFTHIYSYDPVSGKTEILKDNIYWNNNEDMEYLRPLFIYVVGEDIFAQRINGDFYKYSPDGWIKVWKESELNNHIMGISISSENINKKSDLPEGSLLFTQTNGIYKIKDGKPVKISTEIDTELSETQINRVIEDNDHTLFIGTIGKGIFHITKEGKLMDILNISSGLNNNTVLGIFQDAEQNIWAALDDGITLIHKGIPIEQIHPFSKNYVQGLGTGYDIGEYKGKLIFVTNQGAYIENNDDFSLIESSKGQNWFVKTFDHQTFIGGNDQTIVLNDTGEKIKLPFSGTDIKKVIIHGKEILLQSTYFTLEIYRKDNSGKWNYSHTVSGVEMPIRHIEVDADGTIWATHWTKGLVKIQLTSDLHEISKKTLYPSLTDPKNEKPIYMLKLRGKTVFSEGTGLFDYDQLNDKFMPADRLEILNTLPDIRDAWEIDDNRFWIAGKDFYNLVLFDGEKSHIEFSVPVEIFPRKNNGENSSVFINDDSVYFIVNDIIGKVNLSEVSKNIPKFPLSIHKIGSFNSLGKFISMPIISDKKPNTPNENLSVEVSYPNYNGYPIKYHFTLTNGSVTLDSISEYPEIFYPELKWGNHVFKCSVLDINLNPVSSLEYEFYIQRPVPLRWWAILIYCVILILLFYFISKLVSRWKLRKQSERFEKEEAEKNLKIHQQSLLIAHQEKMLLESKLSEKSKELASMALSEYGHRQAIENINASLVDLRNKGKDVTVAENVLKEIRKNEGDTRVFWDVFEKNFDLIHEHFFRNLRKAYPSLTSADMKFCALLRMNMSTKEISRFTNLSVRGVETARYRLRKKFGLNSEQSLVQFLIDFSLD